MLQEFSSDVRSINRYIYTQSKCFAIMTHAFGLRLFGPTRNFQSFITLISASAKLLLDYDSLNDVM